MMSMLPVLSGKAAKARLPGSLPTLGWREWVIAPELHVSHIKAKVDTGARTSSLHAEQIEIFQSRGHLKVRFVVLPDQRTRVGAVHCEVRMHDERHVRSSNGSEQLRPVIRTPIKWGDVEWEIDLTLTSRDLMGFRMLLGREAIRRRFLVDTGRSFLGGRPTSKGHDKRHDSGRRKLRKPKSAP
jgi:hypothetical protein